MLKLTDGQCVRVLRLVSNNRAASHDGCSWVLEWEGWRAQKKPGWLHPSVFVLTAAYYSFDMERRRLSRADGGRLRNWWDGLVQKLQAVMGG